MNYYTYPLSRIIIDNIIINIQVNNIGIPIFNSHIFRLNMRISPWKIKNIEEIIPRTNAIPKILPSNSVPFIGHRNYDLSL